jgi:hypothetical protein
MALKVIERYVTTSNVIFILVTETVTIKILQTNKNFTTKYLKFWQNIWRSWKISIKKIKNCSKYGLKTLGQDDKQNYNYGNGENENKNHSCHVGGD